MDQLDDETIMSLVKLLAVVVMQLHARQSLVQAILASGILREPTVKVTGFYETVVPLMKPPEFRRFFRMNKETLASLVDFLSDSDVVSNILHRVPLQKKIAFTCAYLGSRTSTLRLAQVFGVSEETFVRSTDVIMDSIISKIDKLIHFPRRNELRAIADEFDKIGRHLKNVIGCLDGMHVEITLERDEIWCKDAFRNYKQWHSIHLQAVATYDLRFLHIYVGWPGRAHDGRVFRNSGLPITLQSDLYDGPVPLQETYHILADSAFPLSKEVMTPYPKPRTRALTADEKLFNRHLSSKRQNVERSFSLLLRRFPRLIKLNQKTLVKKIKVVMAACALHNLCILETDNVDHFLRHVTKRPQQPRGLVGHERTEDERLMVASIKRQMLLEDIQAHL